MAEMEKENTMAETEATPIAEEKADASAEKTAVPAKKADKKKKKSDKPNFFVRIWRRTVKFFRDYNSERKKISWKPWREVWKSAVIVIVTVAIFSLVIWGLDQLFGTLFAWLARLI